METHSARISRELGGDSLFEKLTRTPSGDIWK